MIYVIKFGTAMKIPRKKPTLLVYTYTYIRFKHTNLFDYAT